MDTINKQVLNNPDLDDGVDMPTASDVVDNILNNQVSDYDYTTWKSFTDAEQAEAFREIVGIWASRIISGYDTDLAREVARIDITEYIEKVLLRHAVLEGYSE
jgi:hypothetical protein